MIARIRAVLEYVGRRGGSLLFLGMVFLSSGYRFLTEPPYDMRNYVYITKFISVGAVGWVCILVAAVMALGAVWKRAQPYGFSLAAGLAMFFATSFFAAFITGVGTKNAHVSSMIYIAFAAFLMMVSGWKENDEK